MNDIKNSEYIQIHNEYNFSREVKSMVAVGNDLWVAMVDGTIFKISIIQKSKFKRFIKRLFKIWE